MLLHDTQELEDHLGARANKHLTLALALGIDDRVESVVLSSSANMSGQHLSGSKSVQSSVITHQDGYANHVGRWIRKVRDVKGPTGRVQKLRSAFCSGQCNGDEAL